MSKTKRELETDNDMLRRKARRIQDANTRAAVATHALKEEIERLNKEMSRREKEEIKLLSRALEEINRLRQAREAKGI